MNTQSHQGATALTYPFHLSKNDLEAIKGISTAGSVLAMKALAQARLEDPRAMPSEYVQWSTALDKAASFLRDIDFHLKLAEHKPPHYSITYNFTKQEVLALSNLRETITQLLEMVNALTKELYRQEPKSEEAAMLRARICSLRTDYEYQSRAIRAFEETFEKEAKRIMETGEF